LECKPRRSSPSANAAARMSLGLQRPWRTSFWGASRVTEDSFALGTSFAPLAGLASDLHTFLRDRGSRCGICSQESRGTVFHQMLGYRRAFPKLPYASPPSSMLQRFVWSGSSFPRRSALSAPPSSAGALMCAGAVRGTVKQSPPPRWGWAMTGAVGGRRHRLGR